MRIVVDAFGGDNAPSAVIEGAYKAHAEYSKKYKFQIILVGDKKKLLSQYSNLEHHFEIIHADGVMEIEDDPMLIRTAKSGTSMGVAFDLLKKDSADAMVSAGSTAALMVGGSMVVGRIKGIKRPALSPIMPSISGNYIILDGGSNLECRPEMLLQFAVMGGIYMNKIEGIKKPRIGLLNIGTEEEKGRELERETYKLLREKAGILNGEFIGNVEAREVPLGACDVIITDGFTGNMFLKTVEGMGVFMKQSLRGLFAKNAATKIGYLLSKSGVEDVRRKTDYRETGGAPLLGTAKPVIKAHGSSDALAFKNAIRQALEFVNSGAIDEIERAVSK